MRATFRASRTTDSFIMKVRLSRTIELDIKLIHHSCTSLFLNALTQELQYIEFFAGEANVFKAVRAASVTSAAVDLSYLPPTRQSGKTNAFDVLSTSGFGFLGSTLFVLEHCAWKRCSCTCSCSGWQFGYCSVQLKIRISFYLPRFVVHGYT